MTNPTSNYGWPMPTATDLVTDLPADFAAFGQPVDTSLKALNPETTLGDISYRSSTANTNTRLGVGSTGNVLTVAGGVPTWAAPAAVTPTFAGASVYNSALQTITNNTFTALTFDTEQFDTNAFHSTATNTSRFTIPAGYAGKYLINGQVLADNNVTGKRAFYFYINGVGYLFTTTVQGSTIEPSLTASWVANLAVADYVELFYFQNSGASRTVDTRIDYCRFSISYLGA